MTVLLAGDDRAANHHDAGLMDQAGRTLARARLSEGAAGMARPHALIGGMPGTRTARTTPGSGPGIETDHGPWVTALAAAGYAVFCGESAAGSPVPGPACGAGAKSGTGDRHVLADMVRAGAHQLRPVADDTGQAQAVKVVARAHKTLFCVATNTAGRRQRADHIGG